MLGHYGKGCDAVLAMTASALAIIVATAAWADNECGSYVGPNDTITCDATSYTVGPGDNITYFAAGTVDGLTLRLDDPALVVDVADDAVSVINDAASANDVAVEALRFERLETNGIENPGINVVNAGTGDARVRLEVGVIETRRANAFGVLAEVDNGTSTASAEIQINGGQIATRGGGARGARVRHAGSSGLAEVRMTDGVIATRGTGASGIDVDVDNGGASTLARVDISGGQITTQGNGAEGVLVFNRGSGASSVIMSGGEVTARGNDADGIRVQNGTLGNYSVSLSGPSQITSGTNAAAGVRVIGAQGGTIDIGAGVLLDGGASGIALRDGDANLDASDEIGGDVIVSSRGILNGDVVLGMGNDSFTLAAGMLSGNIYGDDALATAGDGDDHFIWSGGALTGGFLGANGSDEVQIGAGAAYDGTVLLDGGAGVGVDGWIDTLIISGQDVSIASGRLINWENIVLDNSTLRFADNAVSVSADPGMGLTLRSGAVLDGQGDFALSGNMALQPGALFLGTGAGAGVFSVSGDLDNRGMLSLQDGQAGDVLAVAGDYSGGGRLWLDADFALEQADMLTVTGGVVSGTTLIEVANASTGAVSGNDVPLIGIGGATGAGDFALAGDVDAGIFSYGLVQQGGQWSLQVRDYNEVAALYQAAPQVLHNLLEMPSLEQRVGGRQNRSGAWVRLHSRRFDTDLDATVDASYDGYAGGLQVGYDMPVAAGIDGQWVFGLTAQYGSLDSKVRGGGGVASVDAQGFGLGATATWYGHNGFYFDAQAQLNRYEADYEANGADLAQGRDVNGHGLSVELGQRLELSQHASLIPQVQLSWTELDIDDFTDEQGSPVRAGSHERVTGRLGVAYERVNPVKGSRTYVLANLIKDFSDGSVVNVSGRRFESTAPSSWAEIGIGTEHRVDDATTVYAAASYRKALGGNDEAVGLNVGLRLQW